MFNTRNNFDSFTPGMKAKLDPAYRRNTQVSEFPRMTGLKRETSRFARPSFLPFTSNNKVNRITDRIDLI